MRPQVDQSNNVWVDEVVIETSHVGNAVEDLLNDLCQDAEWECFEGTYTIVPGGRSIDFPLDVNKNGK